MTTVKTIHINIFTLKIVVAFYARKKLTPCKDKTVVNMTSVTKFMLFYALLYPSFNVLLFCYILVIFL